ncbi:MAG: AbrB/MazE/SpoVT family DNA-binding domain-containing protein [Thermanaeromonas sp.]|uniref:Transcriptional regulator, AbrB family n=1 Tax=Thermanaeromonas toyohensis ToBE TaxID=698762 RepID=A0A1W1VD00_9FIRM|nr:MULTISPECIES: AbrB/MazE/SpoVT family DNA-binding domain-containing protein [Thermanaeromonas]MCG0278597.1 AbrB/MazE/SpoVT family DNA-binding domain-containing protein [Thermanaeromonas sp.]SMB91248.1 transcriptional regulator, AbrB family [Thermanaeromonas toyohensis ToBE]
MSEDIIIETLKLGARCQMVLPYKIRKSLGLSEGDEILVQKTGNTIVIIPKPKSYAERLLGLHREIWNGVDPDSYVNKERDSWGN